MSKRWTFKDDHFLVRYHKLGADYIAAHDLGFKSKGAGEKRLKILKESGVFDAIREAQKCAQKAYCAHVLSFSKSKEAREIVEIELNALQ